MGFMGRLRMSIENVIKFPEKPDPALIKTLKWLLAEAQSNNIESFAFCASSRTIGDKQGGHNRG